MPSRTCELRNFQPSSKTLEYLEDLRQISVFKTALQGFISAGTLHQLLSGRGLSAKASAKVAGLNISLYDWELASSSLKDANIIGNAAMKRIIQFGVLDTSGKDNEFWRCMDNITN